ncbi:MAG TPA: hypothetical protein VHB21_15330, partial [Minicystis sp.]|nr:hypothetical protein [Minicystis sp.]
AARRVLMWPPFDRSLRNERAFDECGRPCSRARTAIEIAPESRPHDERGAPGARTNAIAAPVRARALLGHGRALPQAT